MSVLDKFSDFFARLQTPRPTLVPPIPINQYAGWHPQVSPTIGEETFPDMGEVFQFSTPQDAQLAMKLIRLQTDRTQGFPQLKFLLSQAPMIDAPTTLERLLASRSPYAYVHPKTLAKWVKKTLDKPSCKFPGSPTVYVLTSLMPENYIIYSPNPMPGITKILAGTGK